MQIAAGAGAAVLAMLLITGLALAVKACLRRSRSRDRKDLYAKTELPLAPPWQKGTAASLVPTYLNAPSSDPLYRWNSQDLLPHPYQELVTSPQGSVESLYSSSEMDDRRLYSSGDLPSPDLKEIPVEEEVEEHSGYSSKPIPSIHFHLLFETSSSTLRVRVVRVTNLPFKYRKKCSSFVKVSLLGRRKSSVHTNVIHKSLNPEYEEWFSFSGYSLDEFNQYTLKFTVYVKIGYLKNKFIGDLFYPISKKPLHPDVLLACTDTIRLTSKKSKLTKSSSGELGHLLIVLQYQHAAARMKVLIRKAESLPKGGRVFKQPDHYVIINLVHGHEVKTSHETRAVSSLNPVWNQPFLFDIPPEKEGDHYWLQFVVMRGRMYSRDGIVGHVPVGPETTSSGSNHWLDVMNARSPEIPKWHPIVPL